MSTDTMEFQYQFTFALLHINGYLQRYYELLCSIIDRYFITKIIYIYIYTSFRENILIHTKSKYSTMDPIKFSPISNFDFQ